MLYGMSLVFGETGGSTLLIDIRRHDHRARHVDAARASAIFLTIVGFAFKVSAVPFHFWTPDTYEGAPTPVTAFLSVASKAGGFVALLTISLRVLPVAGLVGAGALGARGGVDHLRQPRRAAPDQHRPHARVLVDRAGRLHPRAARGRGRRRRRARRRSRPCVIYLLIYARDEPRRVRGGHRGRRAAPGRAEIETYAGLWARPRPGSRSRMTIFLFSLAGIPPFAGWFAKFVMFRAVLDASTPSAVVARCDRRASSSVIAFFYYAAVARRCGSTTGARGRGRRPSRSPPRSPSPSASASPSTVVVGVYPQLFARIGELAFPI